MNLFEVDWEFDSSGGNGYLIIYIDGVIYLYQPNDYGDENVSGTFKAYLTGEEHLVGFYVERWYDDSPTLRITKIRYGEMDALAEVVWNINDEPVELIDGALVLTPVDSLEALGTLPEMILEPLPLSVSFDWEVSSEYGYDYFEFYIDDILVLKTSGLDNRTFSGSFSDEEHTLRFAYMKDETYGAYNDLARVWNVNVGGEEWLPDENWILGGDVLPVFSEGKIVLSCGDDETSWAERTYIPPAVSPQSNVRIRYLRDELQIDQVSVEVLDTFFVDAVVEGFDLLTGSWIPVEPTIVEARLERYDETGLFVKISDSQVFAHPDGFFRLLQKCDAPPGTYYLKTTATVGDITQIERLKIKAKVNI